MNDDGTKAEVVARAVAVKSEAVVNFMVSCGLFDLCLRGFCDVGTSNVPAGQFGDEVLSKLLQRNLSTVCGD